MNEQKNEQKKVSFLNSEMALSIIQCVEIQYRAYQKFLEITGDEKEAGKQTLIYMSAMLHNPIPPNKGV